MFPPIPVIVMGAEAMPAAGIIPWLRKGAGGIGCSGLNNPKP